MRLIVGVYADDLVVIGEAKDCKESRTHLRQFFPVKTLRLLTCSVPIVSSVLAAGLRMASDGMGWDGGRFTSEQPPTARQS